MFYKGLRVQSQSGPHEDDDEGGPPQRGGVVRPAVLELDPGEVLEGDAGEEHAEQRGQPRQLEEAAEEEGAHDHGEQQEERPARRGADRAEDRVRHAPQQQRQQGQRGVSRHGAVGRAPHGLYSGEVNN